VKTFNLKILAIGVCVLAGMMSQAGAQEVHQQGQPSTAYQQYQYQQPNRSTLRKSYEPNAGVGQNHRSLREQINPCNTNYGIIMDGWQDVVLQTTLKSVEWWLSVVLFIALAAVGFDDLYRKQRAKDMLEATAGMGHVLLNDRNYCLRRANDSIDLNNKLILQGDTLAKEADARSQAESHLAIRTMAIQAAENGPILEAENPPAVPTAGNHLALDGAFTELGDDIQGEQTVAASGIDDAEQSAAGNTKEAEDVKYSTLEHGGKKYKVPTSVRLLVQAQDRKIENQRVKINQLEERLRQYEKD
jgi:hypothetical protein